jgi:uncharacterized protein
MRIVVSGSTGMIGSALVPALRDAGHEVRRLVRRKPTHDDEIFWQPGEGRLDPQHLAGTEGVVHLSGENLGRRWTDTVRARIRESRVRSTEVLSRALAQLDPRPRVMLSASAIGIYGSRGNEELTERSALGGDFLANLCKEWEGATAAAERAGIRVVHTRSGVVLSPRGGMLERVLPIFRMGAGGKLGSGNQWLSWISLTDMVGVIRFQLEGEESGAVNVVAPESVTNADFTRALGMVLGRPTLTFVPAFALQLAYGEMAKLTILASQRAVPVRLVNAGYGFRYSRLDEALRAELARG